MHGQSTEGKKGEVFLAGNIWCPKTFSVSSYLLKDLVLCVWDGEQYVGMDISTVQCI